MIDDRLSHLTDAQIKDLIDRYYNSKQPVAELLEDFQISVQPSRLVAMLPPLVLEDLCPYCPGQHLLSKRRSRTGASWKSGNPYCPNCGHGKRNPCRCQNCRERNQRIAETESKLKNEAIRAISQTESFEFDPRDLDFVDFISLLSAVRHSIDENYECISPFVLSPIPYSPTPEFTNDRIVDLYRKRFLGISPQSDINAFEYDDDLERVTAFIPSRVVWMFLPGVDFNRRREIVSELELAEANWSSNERWFEKIDETWRTIVIQECLEYFRHLLAQRNLELDVREERIKDVIERSLDHFSPAQTFNLSWQSARDCVDYMATKGIPKKQAQAMVRSILDRKIDRHIAEKWTPRHSKRDFNCPQSSISLCLFDTVLQIGEKALRENAPPRVLVS